MTPVNALSGSVFDERNDTIDFSTGEPVHTHGGAAIDLSSNQSSCPDVYKYAYLMDEGGAKFGKETAPNGFAWTAKTDIASLDPNATAYRVRDKAGSILLDWTSIHPDASGIFKINLYRNGEHPIAQLGNTVDELHLELRLRTTTGNDTVLSSCWNNHPMAAPLEILPMEKNALFQASLPGNTQFISLGTAGAGMPVMDLPIVQQTVEPVTIALQPLAPTGTVNTTAVDTQVVMAVQAFQAGVPCSMPTDSIGCTTHPAYTTTYPTLTTPVQGAWSVSIIDDVAGAQICAGTALQVTTCTIPARQANEAPHSYHAVFSLSAQTLVANPANDPGPFGDFTVGTTSYSGIQPQLANLTYCSRIIAHTNPMTGITYTNCFEHTSYARIVALDRATIAFDAATLGLTTSLGNATTAVTPTYVAPSALTLPASSWDGGDKGL